MLITKTNPAGIDWYVQQIQTKLHDTLIRPDHLNITDTTQYRAYGRCYRNKKSDGYVAENYEGGDEYSDVYWDDTLTMITFFGMGRTDRNGVSYESQMHLVVFADLSKLAIKDRQGNVIAHRADEELREMFMKVIGSNSFGFQYVSTELWLENVLREYPGSIRDERLKFVDMHPRHCFRFNFLLSYNPNKIC